MADLLAQIADRLAIHPRVAATATRATASAATTGTATTRAASTTAAACAAAVAAGSEHMSQLSPDERAQYVIGHTGDPLNYRR